MYDNTKETITVITFDDLEFCRLGMFIERLLLLETVGARVMFIERLLILVVALIGRLVTGPALI